MTPMEHASWHLLRDDFGKTQPAASCSRKADAKSETATVKANFKERVETVPVKVEANAVPVKAEASGAKIKVEEAGAGKASQASPSLTLMAAETEKPTQKDQTKAAASGAYHTEKLWSYEECPRRVGSEIGHLAHWPEQALVYSGIWVAWLPEDWSQCEWKSAGGRTETKYVSPAGKVAHSKNLVEKACGRDLLLPAHPIWPLWLPKDWYITHKSNSLTKMCLVSPDKKRIFNAQTDMEKYLNDTSYKPRSATLLNLPPSV